MHSHSGADAALVMVTHTQREVCLQRPADCIRRQDCRGMSMVVRDMEEDSTCWRAIHGGGQYMWLASACLHAAVSAAVRSAHLLSVCLLLRTHVPPLPFSLSCAMPWFASCAYKEGLVVGLDFMQEPPMPFSSFSASLKDGTCQQHCNARHDLQQGGSMGQGRVFPSQRADVTIRIEVVVNTDPENVAEGT